MRQGPPRLGIPHGSAQTIVPAWRCGTHAQELDREGETDITNQFEAASTWHDRLLVLPSKKVC